MKAISAEIYTNPLFQGCSLKGISTFYTEVYIPHPKGPIDITGNELNVCRVIRREIFDKVVFHLEPYNAEPGSCSAGGAFVYSSDSRFSELFNHQYGAIALHDRIE